MTDIALNFQVAGTSYRVESFQQANVGPGDALEVQPDPSNQYDPFAIKILKQGIHIGFVPRQHTLEVKRRFLDEEAEWELVVVSVWKRGCVAEMRLIPRD